MRKMPLSLAVAQPGVTGGDVGRTVLAHATLVRACAARVVVFPELSLTGYELDAPALATDDPRLLPLVAACAEVGAVALVGAPITEAGREHIAVLGVDGAGVRVLYRKMCLSEEERARFAPGSTPARVEVDGWRLGLAVCRDTGIIEHQDRTAGLGIDAYLAGTLMHPEETAEQDRRARHIATHHGVFVGVASFAGATGSGYDRSAGCSGIWAPGGTPLARAGVETDCWVRSLLPVSGPVATHQGDAAAFRRG